jgi:lysophospholipid acyltransferase (LPLAT)-like uncharacterized protein
VQVAGFAIALVLRLLYLTLRLQVDDSADVMDGWRRGERVVWATWHDGIILLPLMKTRVERTLRPRVMLSWHRDGEIAAQAVQRFGVHVIRGSSTRGWLGALRGLVDANTRGEDLVVVPDGPRGPRHVAKEGVTQLARVTGLPVVAIGIAAHPARRFRSWDRMQLPRPFSRVAIVLGAPVPIERRNMAASLAAVQASLADVTVRAAAHVGAVPL